MEITPAADQAGVGNRMMGGAKGPGGKQRYFFRQEAGGGENFSGLDGLVQNQVRKDGRYRLT